MFNDEEIEIISKLISTEIIDVSDLIDAESDDSTRRELDDYLDKLVVLKTKIENFKS